MFRQATAQRSCSTQRNPLAKDAGLTLAGVLCRRRLIQIHWSWSSGNHCFRAVRVHPWLRHQAELPEGCDFRGQGARED